MRKNAAKLAVKKRRRSDKTGLDASSSRNNSISFLFDGRLVNLSFGGMSGLTPTTTVLNYLRNLHDHLGTKEGCAEGDCGACTVVIGELTDSRRVLYRAVDSCLVFLPMLHRKHLITVENLRSRTGALHPVQQAMVDAHGSQCGFCTPGIVMSLYALAQNSRETSREDMRSALTGNLCRCTGYRPILEAAYRACSLHVASADESGGLDAAALLRSIPRRSVEIQTDRQRYDQPVTLDECLKLLERYPDALLVNGATDVALRVTKKRETLPHIIDCSQIIELRRILRNSGAVRVGGGVRLNDLLHEIRLELPALHTMLEVFGSTQIRNLATLGGNLGTASPVGDMLPVLIAYGARIVLASRKGTRSIEADRFVTGYRSTERRPDELIKEIVIPRPPERTWVKAYKVSKRRDLDIATVSAAFRLETDAAGRVRDIRMAYGGMADRTCRALKTESFLRGKQWTRHTVEEAQAQIEADFSPISDVRGSAGMRRIAARNLLLKFWNEVRGI